MTPPDTARAVSEGRRWVEWYFSKNLRLVFWRDQGDAKGPTGAEGRDWPKKVYTIDDYRDGDRVGIVTGHELTPGHFLHDVDIDWAAGAPIATAMLPPTAFEYGRASKPVSHRMYTLPVPLPTKRFEDPISDARNKRQTILELRGTSKDGSFGCQSMAPPSVWESDGKREAVAFRQPNITLQVVDDAERFQHLVALSACGMLLAKHLGHNGFGHEARLEWAGFLLRERVSEDDLIRMGEAMSIVCNNREVSDVRTVVMSTAANLKVEDERVKGGPSLAKRLGKGGRQVIATIREWLGRARGFAKDKNGTIIANHQENIQLALEVLNVSLSYDEFADRELIQVDDGPAEHLEDPQVDALWLQIDRECGFRPTYDFFSRVVNYVARSNRFHPVRDYLASLSWDGVPRIDGWMATYGGADSTPYTEAVSAIVLMAAVKRVLEPGCKYDEMVVWESSQGIGKSSTLRALCPRDDWFSDDLPLNSDSKVLIERTKGKWIIEASDLAGKRKAEIEHLKAMLSRQVDSARMAYGRRNIERPRHFIIAGTTNSDNYLPDPTGARRFWPVKVTRFDIEGLIRDRDQLWAEALVRVRAGASIRLPEELWPLAAREQEQRREVDPWEAMLLPMLESIEPDKKDGKRRVTADGLWMALGLDAARRDRGAQLRVSQIMQRLGFKRSTVRNEEGKAVQGYVGVLIVDESDVEEGPVGETPF